MVSDDEARPPERVDRASEQPADRGAERAGPDEHYEPDELPETIRHRLERLVPELVKKTFAAGLGAVFSTEEGIRKIAREGIPDFAGYIASSADGAKDKVFDVIARETREFLGNLNVSDEIAKILTTLSFEIKTEIRFIPNTERFIGAEPDVKASVRLKRADEGKAERPAERATERPAERPTERPAERREERRDERREDDGRDGRSRLRFWQRERDGEGGDDPDR
jgi:hypothetical protein